MISNLTLTRFIQQSNLIEGIERAPTDAEFEAHQRLLALDQITIAALEAFVDVVAPGKKLRTLPGMDVRVGNHIPPPSGPMFRRSLRRAGRRPEMAREVGVSTFTIYNWKAKYGGMEPSAAIKLRHLEDENGRLKKLVAEVCLDREMLKALLIKRD